MPASRTRCLLIPNQVGCRLPRTRWLPGPGRGRRSRRDSNPRSSPRQGAAFAAGPREQCAPLPGIEPGTLPFVAAHSVLLSYRGLAADPGVEPGPPPHRFLRCRVREFPSLAPKVARYRRAGPHARHGVFPGERVCSTVEFSKSTPPGKWAASSAGGGCRTPGKRFWRPLRFRSSPTLLNSFFGHTK